MCAGIVLAYSLAVSLGFISPSNGLTIWQSNTIKAQRFLTSPRSKTRILIAGSSLSNNIRAEWIGEDVANLALSGGAAQTGLLIANRCLATPEVCLVEVNETLSRATDTALADSLFGRWGRAERWLPVLREEYRPLSVLVSMVKRRFRPERPPLESERANALASPVRRKVIRQVLKQQSAGLSASDRKEILAGAGRLRLQIERMQERGVRVVLFDVPGERRVHDSLRQKQITQLLKDCFPPAKYAWLPAPPERNWVTSDGGHLIAPDARAFGHYLRRHIQSPSESASR